MGGADDHGGIYCGGGSDDDGGGVMGATGSADSPGGDAGAASPQAPLAHMSDICAWSTTETATSIEITCDVCKQVCCLHQQ